MSNNKKNYNIITALLLIVAMALFLGFCVDMTGESLRRPELYFIVVSFAIVGFVFRKNLPKDAVIWTIAGGIFIKIAYILYTAVWTRQHDVISFGAGEGHAAYIEYILYNKSLPNFDPRLIWGFFQPPLHHAIAAAWMWINVRLGIAERQLQESVQVLTLCYMCVLMLVTYFICKELAMKQRGTLITMLIVSFHPIFILLSGSINNDALSTALSAVALYIAILWYKKPKVFTIILLALAIGFAMMAKLSAGLIAPGIGALMLYKLITDRTQWKKYIAQFAAFAIVVFPIGLWWPVRNKILWNMPANYIPEVGEQLTHSGIISRLFDIRMSSVYPAMINNSDAYDEYNVFLAMVKTSLFGESNFGQLSSIINPFAIGLFVTCVLLIIVALISFVMLLVDKEASPEAGYKILLAVTAVSVMAGYMMFALGYNNFSAQDFRYAAIVIVVMALFTGLYDDRADAIASSKKCQEVKAKRIGIYRKSVFAITILFAFCSAMVYFLVGIIN